MAREIMMRHPRGRLKRGFYGYSWTSCFFGGLPAILRGDVAVGIVVLVAWACTLGLAGVLWGFVYNKRYTLGLLRQGYQFCGHPWAVEAAMYALGLSGQPPQGRWGHRG